VEAVVQNGVWVRQDTAFDSPINLGAHCAKGASVREHGHGEHRLRYPMKLVNGKYQRISWEQAINEVGDKLLQLRQQAGQDAIFWIGSSKHNNEQSYLLRKFVSMWGSNNTDHQARICHSTTVAGVAQTYGYGAMTNSFNDLSHSKAVLFIGASDLDAALPACEGTGREDDRDRPALYPHRPLCPSLRAHPARHRHRAGLGHSLAYLRERLGRQAIHRAPYLPHG
jgi:formate dehydrogenase major subunit